jgi:hypothetical membrane protein
VGALQFVLSMAVEQAFTPGYSLRNNYISDLGVGPHAWVFNSSIILLGIFIGIAVVLLSNVFPRSGVTRGGLLLLGLSALGAIGVGLFPENTTALDGQAHTLFALVTFLTGNLSMFLLGPAIRGALRSGGLALLGYLGGAVGLLALVLYATGNDSILGKGGMERLIVAPLLLWGFLLGLALLRGARQPRIVPWAPGEGSAPPA